MKYWFRLLIPGFGMNFFSLIFFKMVNFPLIFYFFTPFFELRIISESFTI